LDSIWRINDSDIVPSILLTSGVLQAMSRRVSAKKKKKKEMVHKNVVF
jgi:hypothetical protein